jgi:hypothetical protein
MRKTQESEDQLKLAIRNLVARNPLLSVSGLQRASQERGFKTTQGNPLDWYYVAKVIRKLNREKAFAVDRPKIDQRLAITKEAIGCLNICFCHCPSPRLRNSWIPSM